MCRLLTSSLSVMAYFTFSAQTRISLGNISEHWCETKMGRRLFWHENANLNHLLNLHLPFMPRRSCMRTKMYFKVIQIIIWCLPVLATQGQEWYIICCRPFSSGFKKRDHIVSFLFYCVLRDFIINKIHVLIKRNHINKTEILNKHLKIYCCRLFFLPYNLTFNDSLNKE